MSSISLVKKLGTAHPLFTFLSYDKLSHVHKTCATKLSPLNNLQYSQVVKDQKYHEAMQQEINTLKNNGALSLMKK